MKLDGHFNTIIVLLVLLHTTLSSTELGMCSLNIVGSVDSCVTEV